MKLILENIGSIKHGEIDLDRDFYVFVGYNNSGKTYVSQILWELMNNSKKYFEDLNLDFIDFEQDKVELTQEVLDKILKELSDVLNKKLFSNLFYSNDNFEKSKISIQVYLDEILAQELNLAYDVREAFVEVSKDVHQQALDVLITSKNPDTNLIQFQHKITPLEMISGITYDYVELIIQTFPNINFYKVTSVSRKETPSLVQRKKESILDILSTLLISKFLDVDFLPANRIFFASYWNYLNEYARQQNELISKELSLNNYDKAKKLSKPNYTKITGNILNKLQRTNKHEPIKTYENEIQELQKIMTGSISIQNFLGKPDFKFNFSNKELDMYLASSSVNQLTLLFLYFKYWAYGLGDFLIIDEPEENLHPENQIKLLELLIGFSKKNHNKILITTHSPFFTDAINNYLMLGNIDPKKREETAQELGMKTWLDKEKTGIYFFDGEQIHEYKIGDYGTTFKDFKFVQDRIENNADILGDKLFNQLHN